MLLASEDIKQKQNERKNEDVPPVNIQVSSIVSRDKCYCVTTDTVTDQRFSTAASIPKLLWTYWYASSPCLKCPTAGGSLFRIIPPVISGNRLFGMEDIYIYNIYVCVFFHATLTL